ncbi:MAG TPA: hypothetical protein VFN67_26165 [Polyangiales bacterium]|nr:hypothetical protein [Polyangiales bacterium]
MPSQSFIAVRVRSPCGASGGVITTLGMLGLITGVLLDICVDPMTGLMPLGAAGLPAALPVGLRLVCPASPAEQPTLKTPTQSAAITEILD